jgi:hypothetical protein
LNDVYLNNFSGIIPKCLNNLSSLVWKTASGNSITSHGFNFGSNVVLQYLYRNKVRVGWKGRDHEYESTLGLLSIVNFARNKLTGEIPDEIINRTLTVDGTELIRK